MIADRLRGKKEFLLFIVLLTFYTYFIQEAGWSQNARLDLTLSLARDQETHIDSYHQNTEDKGRYSDHYYSYSAPGLSALGVGVYYAMDRLQGLGRNIEVQASAASTPITRYWLYLLTAFTVAGPSALLAVFLYRFLKMLRGATILPSLIVVACGLGTLVLPFSTLYYAHVTAALFAFAAFYTVFMIRCGREDRVNLSLAGFLMGLAIVTEYQTALIGLALFFYILAFRETRRAVARYLIGGLPLIGGLAYYNYVRFGNPLEFGYEYHVTWGRFFQSGVLGAFKLSLSALWAITFGAKGLFIQSPVLLLVPVGLGVMIRDKTYRREALFFIAVALLFLVFNASWVVPNPMGGTSPGPRRLIPILPFVVVPLLFLPRGLRWLFVPLALYSVGAMILITALNPQVSEKIANPLMQYWWPSAWKCPECYIPTIGHVRWGWGSRESLLVPLGALGLGTLAGYIIYAMRKKPVEDRSLVLGTFVIILLIAYLALSSPIDVLHPRDIPWRVRTLAAGAVGGRETSEVYRVPTAYRIAGGFGSDCEDFRSLVLRSLAI